MEIKTRLVSGFAPSLYSMRNPMNSWNLIDSYTYTDIELEIGGVVEASFYDHYNEELFEIGEKDLGLAQRLINSGTEHMKFMRMIQVWADMDMTRFFWSEMDTYKFNSKNSCSTIHKLLNPKNPITMDMFDYYEEDKEIVGIVVNRLNQIREEFLATKDFQVQVYLKRRAKCLLMEGFLQMRTVNTNYAEVRHVVKQRFNHQMKPDWVYTYCKWATTLPYAKELIFCGMEDEFERLKGDR